MLGMEEGEERERAGWSGGGSIEKQQKRQDWGKPKGIMMQKGRRKMILKNLNGGEEEGRKFQPKATNHNNQNWHGQKTVPTTIKMQMDKGKRMPIGKLERNAGQLWKR
jgi:hypothetical protein